MFKKGILLAGCILLLTTGCGSKKLTCTLEEDDQKSSVEFTFKDDVAERMNMEIQMEMEEDVDKDELDEQIKTFKEAYEGYGFEDVEVKAKNNVLNISLSMDAAKFMDEEDNKESLSYDSLKEEFEEDGYTCK